MAGVKSSILPTNHVFIDVTHKLEGVEGLLNDSFEDTFAIEYQLKYLVT